MYANLGVLQRQLSPITRWLRNTAVDHRAVEFDEAHGAIVEHLYSDPAFVNLAVMEGAEAYEIGRLRLSTGRAIPEWRAPHEHVCPVFDVVCIDVARVRTAREATTFVTRFQKATQW
jgi:hypothetical protein